MLGQTHRLLLNHSRLALDHNEAAKCLVSWPRLRYQVYLSITEATQGAECQKVTALLLLQPAEPMLGAKERALLIHEWNEVILDCIKCLLKNFLTLNIKVYSICWHRRFP